MCSPPILALVVGLPGTGKSTLTAALARALGWPVFDKDVLGDVLLDNHVPQTQAASLAYKLLFRLAEERVIKQGQSVFVESAGRQPFILEWAESLTKRSAVDLRIIRCVAPAAVRAERLARRTPGLLAVDARSGDRRGSGAVVRASASRRSRPSDGQTAR